MHSPKPPEQEMETQVEGNLAAEVSLIALDTLELIIQVLHLCVTRYLILFTSGS